jgi:hypothetical protein
LNRQLDGVPNLYQAGFSDFLWVTRDITSREAFNMLENGIAKRLKVPL